MAINPLTPEQLAKVQAFLEEAPKRKKKSAPVAPEAPIEDPFLRSLVENVGSAAESITQRPSPALVSALEATGRQDVVEPPAIEPEPQTGPAPVAPDARKEALGLLASASGPIPISSSPEMEAMRDFQAAQSGAQRGEALLPFVMAAQRINEAWTGAPVDVQTLGAVAKGLRGKESDAAQRLQAAQDFARRQQQGEQFAQTMAQRADETKAEHELRLAQAAAQERLKVQELDLEERKIALAEKQMRQRSAAGARGAMPGAPPLSAVDAAKEYDKEQARQLRELQIEKAKRELSGEPTKAQKQEQQKQVQEVDYRSKQIDDNLAQLEKLIKESGTYNAVGPHNTFLTSRIYQIAVDTAKLVDPSSVAREGEVTAAQKYLLFEPSPFIRNETALAIVRDFRKQAQKRKQTAYEVRGLLMPQTKAQGVPGFPFVVVDKQTGREFTIKSQEELDKVRPYADRLQMKGAQ